MEFPAFRAKMSSFFWLRTIFRVIRYLLKDKMKLTQKIHRSDRRMVTAIGALLWMIEVLGDFSGFGSEFRRRLQQFHHAPVEMEAQMLGISGRKCIQVKEATRGDLHQIEIGRIAGGLGTWVANVALGIEPLGQSHRIVRPDSEARTGGSHQFNGVQGHRARFHLLLLGDILDTVRTENGKGSKV